MVISCQTNSKPFAGAERKRVNDSVTMMMSSISKSITSKGPIAWLDYFENAPDFFMASDGELAFKDYPSAKTFITTTLVKSIPNIKLKWDDLIVDPLTSGLASVGAGFHEDLTDSNGNILSIDGYFTATAHHNVNGWKLQNLHWSIKHPSGK
jgi:hypothetical protein